MTRRMWCHRCDRWVTAEFEFETDCEDPGD
jgi:hypothetical protein